MSITTFTGITTNGIVAMIPEKPAGCQIARADTFELNAVPYNRAGLQIENLLRNFRHINFIEESGSFLR
jgi:hypothetical protein